MVDKRTKVSKMGKTTGKLRIAINVALLLAPDAMAAMNVNAIENPRLPSINVRKKSGKSLTGLPATNPKVSKASKPSTNNNKVLYVILASNTIEGSAI